MRRNWMIGVTACALVMVVTFAAGYRTGTGSHAQQMIDAREAGATFQREWFEGVDKAQAERAEKNRVDYEQQLREIEARKAHEQEIVDEARTAYDYRKDPSYLEARARLPESERAAFDERVEAEWSRLESARRAAKE